MSEKIVCNVCFRHCHISEGETGFCHVRKNENGDNVPVNYGLLTSIALDPIEKKPIVRFMSGSKVLSVVPSAAICAALIARITRYRRLLFLIQG